MANYQDIYGNSTYLGSVKADDKGYLKGYVEIGTTLYKIRVTDNLKTGGHWVQLTKLQPRNRRR